MARPKKEAAAHVETAAAPVEAREPVPASAPVEERKVRAMEASNITLAEFKREHYLCTAFEGTRPEDLLKTEYWATVSNQLRPRARLEAWAHDGTWMAEFVVLESGRSWARLQMLAAYYFTAADTAQSQAAKLNPYLIEFKGPSLLWCVIRKSDMRMLKDNEQTMEGALAWAAEHHKAQR